MDIKLNLSYYASIMLNPFRDLSGIIGLGLSTLHVHEFMGSNLAAVTWKWISMFSDHNFSSKLANTLKLYHRCM